MSVEEPSTPPPLPARPAPPESVSPDPAWPHFGTWERVQEALFALPVHFHSKTVLEGIHAPDVQTLAAPLGATIEDQVVQTLNRLRAIWDPSDELLAYRFVRQAQTFPDVLLMRETDGDPDILFGIELKGWFLLAKEKEPNYRFKTTPAACAAADLLVIVPWALSNVFSGSPLAYRPFIIGSRTAAEYRNYHWQHVRVSRSSTEIDAPDDAAPYPSKKARVSDKPAADSGGNFGRIARTGLMDDFIEAMRRNTLLGIPVDRWLKFLRTCANS